MSSSMDRTPKSQLKTSKELLALELTSGEDTKETVVQSLLTSKEKVNDVKTTTQVDATSILSRTKAFLSQLGDAPPPVPIESDSDDTESEGDDTSEESDSNNEEEQIEINLLLVPESEAQDSKFEQLYQVLEKPEDADKEKHDVTDSKI